MAEYTILIRVTPPNSYHWRVISEGKTLAQGEALTDFEGRTAAEDAIKHLEHPAPGRSIARPLRLGALARFQRNAGTVCSSARHRQPGRPRYATQPYAGSSSGPGSFSTPEPPALARPWMSTKEPRLYAA